MVGDVGPKGEKVVRFLWSMLAFAASVGAVWAIHTVTGGSAAEGGSGSPVLLSALVGGGVFLVVKLLGVQLMYKAERRRWNLPSRAAPAFDRHYEPLPDDGEDYERPPGDGESARSALNR